MIDTYQQVLQKVVSFTARFGFITRELFFDHLCMTGRTQKYIYWKRLQDENILSCSRSFKSVFYLTKKGRSFCSLESAAPARSMFFVEHDSLVADLFYELLKSGFVAKTWIERELRIDVWEAIKLLGCENIKKFPDLLVDLNSEQSSIRIAVEVERSQKTQARYNAIAYSYHAARHVDLMFFACMSRSHAAVIESAFDKDIFRKAGKIPITFLISDFDRESLEAAANVGGKEIRLRQILLAALKQPESEWGKGRDSDRMTIRSLSGLVERAG